MCESPTALPQEYPDIPSAEGHAVTCPGWRSPPCQQLLWTRFTLTLQDSALTDLTGRARESVGRDDEWLEWSRCFNCLVRQEIMRLKTGFSTAHVWLHERFSNSRSDADQNLGLFLHFCVFFRHTWAQSLFLSTFRWTVMKEILSVMDNGWLEPPEEFSFSPLTYCSGNQLPCFPLLNVFAVIFFFRFRAKTGEFVFKYYFKDKFSSFCSKSKKNGLFEFFGTTNYWKINT